MGAAEWIALGALALAIIGLLCRSTWLLAEIKSTVDGLAAHAEECNRDRERINSRVQRLETVAAAARGRH